MSYVETQTLRSWADIANNSFRYFIPGTNNLGEYLIPPRVDLVDHFSYQFYKKRKRISRLDRGKIKTFLKGFGLGRSTTDIISNRSKNDIRRITEFVSGIFDVLILNDTDFEKSKKALYALIRKILKRSPYGLGPLVKEWKSFGQFLLARANGDKRPARPKGFFEPLFSLPHIIDIENGDNKKRTYMHLAHILSSRQFPNGDRMSEYESLNRFIQNTCFTEYTVDKEFLLDVHYSSAAIASRIEKKINIISSNISISANASFGEKVKDGGRAKETIDYCRNILNKDRFFIKDGDSKEEIKYTPLWEYLRTPDDQRPFGRLGSEVKYYSDFTSPPVSTYIGLDKAFGPQIVECAYYLYKSVKRTHIDMRLATVNEPGYKSRIVTTNEWWCNILQQGPSHIMRNILVNIPRCESSFIKGNQAWSAMYQIKNINPKWRMLCSDLREATDHIPLEIAKAILKGFKSVYNVEGLDTVLEFLELPRRFMLDGIEFHTDRGVMMGEPMAKSILTLHQLIADDLARKKCFKEGSLKDLDEPFFHVGGDDVLAIGPDDYLNSVSEFLLKLGAELSLDKHKIYDKVGKYCEKLIEVRFLSGYDNIGKVYKDYEHSPWIESIKVRLLSPTSKTTEIVNERNIAIGKGLSLSKEIRYLSEEILPKKLRKAVLDRFFQRMRSLIPAKSNTFYHLFLPQKYGGMNLIDKVNIKDVYRNLSKVSLWVLKSYDTLTWRQQEKFRGLLRNNSFRGYEIPSERDEFLDWILERSKDSEYSKLFEMEKFSVLRKGFQNIPDNTIVSRLKDQGWLSLHDQIDQVMRGVLFNKIYRNEAKVAMYNTEALRLRFRKLWELYESKNPPDTDLISAEEFEKVVFAKQDELLYRQIDRRGQDDFNNQFPSLKIGKRLCLLDNASIEL